MQRYEFYFKNAQKPYENYRIITKPPVFGERMRMKSPAEDIPQGL